MAHDWQPDFEQLVDEHQSMVFSLALRMTGDRGLAEEIAQDVFLELDRRLSKIESAAPQVPAGGYTDRQHGQFAFIAGIELSRPSCALADGPPAHGPRAHLLDGL